MTYGCFETYFHEWDVRSGLRSIGNRFRGVVLNLLTMGRPDWKLFLSTAQLSGVDNGSVRKLSPWGVEQHPPSNGLRSLSMLSSPLLLIPAVGGGSKDEISSRRLGPECRKLASLGPRSRMLFHLTAPITVLERRRIISWLQL